MAGGGEITRDRLVPPVLSVPKGGGAIRGIGEKFGASAVTGTGSMTLPLPFSAARAGFTPPVQLVYDSGNGNGVFGFGWTLTLAAVSRRTDKGLPRYDDTDVFVLSDAEDLVAVPPAVTDPDHAPGYRIERFRPRVEGLFARVERWTRIADGDIHWRSISRENVTTVFGRDTASRIADPADPSRVFSWLVCQTHDDKGNAAVYEYAAEDSANVDTGAAHERHRTDADRSAARYIKRIRYGNRVSRLADPDLADPGWMFEALFDYGDEDGQPWPVRPDPFSSYRSGFEVRTYRLCRRMLMRHTFPDEPDVGIGALVRELEFGYETGGESGLFLTSATKRGHRRDGGAAYSLAMPPLRFAYSPVQLRTAITEVEPASLDNLPAGLRTSGSRWADLDGDGLSGILLSHDRGWYYKRNLGAGRFARARELPTVPSAAGDVELMDLAGDGRLDVVDLSRGFFERDGDGWTPLRAFASTPRLPWRQPRLRLADLDGDGRTDVLITEADAVVWLPSLGEDGFGAAHRVLGGPPATFGADLFLADMSGDGLTDLVRIRNGEVVYWPNLGHGRFGAAVTMDAAPRFDRDELFDPGRLRLVDVDGSGVTDIIYSGPEEIRLYFNRSGNGFSEAYSLGAPPDVDGDVAAVDLFGTGTACLVWSSQTPGEQRSLRCMDLLGGVKPHLLVQVDNNLGARTEIEYAPSTADFLADAQAGRPWRTRLPFPVHVVRHAQTTDLVTGNRSSVRYVYHDGYFDGADREFRGFGLIEQWDADFADGPGAAPPVLTKTWHHLGVDLDAGDQYWQAPGPPEIGVGPTRLPAGLTAQERHEALRALKGKMLRQEVYAADGTDREPLPYSVTEYAYGVRVLQPQGEHKHAVCLPYAAETVSRHYERILYDVELNGEAVRRTDPRIVQELTLEVDDWGNRLRTATFAYPRRFPDADLDPLLSAEERRHIAGAQTLLRASLAESDFTNAVESALDHRAPMPAGTRRYELLDVTPATLDQPLPDIAFTDDSATGPGRRLVERTLTRYRRDDLTGALATGVLEPLALPYESYQLAFTPAILDRAYGSLLEQPASVLGVDAGHVYFEGAWWIPGGQVAYSADSAHTAAQELAYAREHFFLPLRYADAFGGTTVVAYDAYDLLVLDTVDPAGNRVSAGERANAAEPAQESLTSALDYQALAARVVSDANRNRSAVAFDALGMVVATAARGKPEENLGDSVDAVLTHPTAEQIAAYFADPVSQSGLLGGATTRSLFDLQAFWRTRDDAQPQPVTVATLSCDAHQDPTGRVTHRIVYSDGFGREIQTKSQAEPQQPGGPARWAASGWIVYTAKNRPARRYEPFFTDTDRYEAGHTAGVSAVTCYDPIGRAVAVLMPDGSFTKSVFTPWRNDDWDANDTVLLDPRTDPDVGPYARAWLTDPQWRTWWQQREGGELGAAEQQAAVKAQAHAGTPASGYADTLGATAATVAALPDERQVIRYHRDGEGAVRQVVDARGITVTATFYDLAGRALHTRIADGGDQRMVPDVAGTPVRRWNARGQAFRHEYDSLRRGTHIWLGDQLVGLTVFGDAEPDGPALNLRGKPRLIFDGAGLTEALRYDFKGNMLAGRRRLSPAPNADWSTLDGLSFAQLATAWEELLEPEVFSFASDYDALNRKVLQVLPDSTVVTTAYNEAGLLERISVKLPGQVAEAPVVAGVAYTAIGRREEVEYGNGVRSVFEHDPATHRLRRITTLRGSTPVQDLSYVYDAVGNVVATADGAQSAVFFAGQVTLPGSQFTYDAVYRLVEASGREHSSLGGPPGHENPARPPLPHPNDPQALRNYTQRFAYDPAGNLTSLEHLAGVGSFSRAYSYDLAANRLLSHTDPSGPVTFQYDEHGNLLGFPHADLTWDHDDRLTEAGLGPGGPHARYWYDGGGTRVRKVVEHQGGLVEERVYQHGYEIYRRRLNGTLVFERRTVAVFDDQRRLALIETVTVDTAAGEPAGVARWRFQLEDLVHSACLELDETAAVISYEEYHPYGTTSLWLAAGAAEVSAKRYRYTGKERDDETGLYYHGARYYAPWIARWTAVDPAQTRDGESPYMYVRGNPVRFFDPDGEDCGEQQSSLPILASMFPGSVGWAVRPQVNPCLANHPDPRVQAWGKWKAEGDKAAALKSATFHRDVSAVAAGTTTAFYTAAYATVTGGPVAMAAADKAAIWALANPAKAALVETLVQFGIGIVDPHPAGFSPMDMPGPADDFGRLARGTVVRKVEEVMGADELVKLSVRHMKPQQIVKAIKETWALDKQGLAKWRGEILEGALAATRYKFFEWVGRLNNGFFRGLDFYANGIGIQVKTLHAIPKVSAYKGYIDSLLELKRGGVTPDGRALREVALDIVLPVGYKGPKGKEAAFDAALTEIKDYGQQLGIPVNVYRTSLEQLNLMQVAK